MQAKKVHSINFFSWQILLKIIVPCSQYVLALFPFMATLILLTSGGKGLAGRGWRGRAGRGGRRESVLARARNSSAHSDFPEDDVESLRTTPNASPSSSNSTSVQRRPRKYFVCSLITLIVRLNLWNPKVNER